MTIILYDLSRLRSTYTVRIRNVHIVEVNIGVVISTCTIGNARLNSI